jgi:hypothetical protein
MGHEMATRADLVGQRGIWLCQCEGCARFVHIVRDHSPGTRFVVKGETDRRMFTATELLPLLASGQLEEEAGCGYIREVFVQTDDAAALASVM